MRFLKLLPFLICSSLFGATSVLVDSTTFNIIQPAGALKIPSGMTLTASAGSAVDFSASTVTLPTGSVAPGNATYITQTANGSLTAEQALSSLSTGIMRVATTTGVITSLTDSAGIAANISDETGSGALVFGTSPTLTSPTFVTPALGTPASGILTNATGLPIATGVSGLGTSVATFLATPSSANLISAVTDETGSGALVFGTSPTITSGVFVTPALGTPASGVLTNATGLPISTGVSGLGSGVATFLATPSSANLLAAITDETGTGAAVFGTSPTFTTQATIPKIVYTGSVTESTGTGTPEGSVTAAVSSLFHRSDGGTGTSLYIKESGSGNTGWVAVASSGGGGTPGGSTTQLQYNNAGAFGGISGATSSGTSVTFGSQNLIATSPKILTDISDTNGNELIKFTATASAVNEFTIANGAASGTSPTLSVTGGDTNISMSLVAKGTGRINSTPPLAVLDSTNATASNNGALISSGGLGVGKDIWYGSSNYAVGGYLRLGGAPASGTHLIDTQITSSLVGFGMGDNVGSGPLLYMGIVSGSYSYIGSRNDHPIRFYQQTAGDSLIIATSGQISAEQTTTSTSTTTGSLITKGGFGVAENINAGGNIVTQTIGKTLGVKSGSNAKAGTFTLTTGAATLSNTSITANSVLVCWLKTASGAITAAPYATAVTVGTSYTIAAGAGDNSTYNYIILEVN